MSTSGTLRDGTLRELLDQYGETISRKIVLMIAWFNLLSRFLNGCRVPLAAGRADEGTCREIKDAVHSLENVQVADLMALLGRVKGALAARH